LPTTVSISIDVPDLARGVTFYCNAFGFGKKDAPVPVVVVLGGLNFELCPLEKPAGSAPSPSTSDCRRYERHWSPVQLDTHTRQVRRNTQVRAFVMETTWLVTLETQSASVVDLGGNLAKGPR
jgi:hypothetical protein